MSNHKRSRGIMRLVRWSAWLGVLVMLGLLAYNAFVPPASLRAVRLNSSSSTVSVAPKIEGLQYADKPYWAVNFFASWCVPCQAEHPQLEQLRQKATVLGVAWKDKSADLATFLDEYGTGFDQVIDDPSGNIGLAWRIKGLPATFVVDGTGNIIYRRLGMIEDTHRRDIETVLSD